MNWIDENSLWIVLGSVLLSVMLGFGYLSTGRRQLLLGIGILASIGVGAILVELTVLTDREAVTETLHRAAGDVERNDLPAALKYLHSTADDVRAQAEAEMPKYEFNEIKIKQNLKITIDRDSQPPRARARFNVMVIVSDKTGTLNEQRVPRYVVVDFALEDGQWKVTGYRHDPPQQGMMRQDKEPEL